MYINKIYFQVLNFMDLIMDLPQQASGPAL